MILTLELPKELESELANEANQLGLSLSEYTLRVLFSRPAVQGSPKTGGDLVAYWQDAGLIGTRPDIHDSLQHARKIREQAEKRLENVKN
ncbi:MAG: hypothetical protein H6668_16630 [Ardenticatenaceae bacterium]|nr:hypothetical protein [Ardenticatenaceae bacterium]